MFTIGVRWNYSQIQLESLGTTIAVPWKFALLKLPDICGGHGIGRRMHMAPHVSHVGVRGAGLRLRAGMALTIEPMITVGHPGVRLLADGWTVVTRDGSPSAQFEHTVLVTDTGVDVLTGGPGAASPNAPWKR